MVSADYAFLVGKLTSSVGVSAIGFKAKVGASMKVHDVLKADMCRDKEVICEDYCIWHTWTSTASAPPTASLRCACWPSSAGAA